VNLADQHRPETRMTLFSKRVSFDREI